MTPRRILIVDDDRRTRDTYEDVFASVGYDVLAVDDGALAVDEITRFRPDVIVLDLIMPSAKMDGFALLAALAARDGAAIPVIVLSALGESLNGGFPGGTSLRVVGVIAKPVSLETLIRAVDSAGTDDTAGC